MGAVVFIGPIQRRGKGLGGGVLLAVLYTYPQKLDHELRWKMLKSS